LPIHASVPQLAGEYFLFTGTGKYFRNVELAPESCLGILEVDATGEQYRVVWGFTLPGCDGSIEPGNGGGPTCELPTHLLNHQVKKVATDGKFRVVYHGHPVNIIALTFVLPLDAQVFSHELWQMMTECPIIFPAGVGVVPWMLPGKPDVGIATSKLMETYDAAIWAHHGIFCTGEDFDSTYGLLHVIEKAAEIKVRVMSMAGEQKRQTITREDFLSVAREFGLALNEDFLL
jgi:rhamnulose-1-phosphate aldolase